MLPHALRGLHLRSNIFLKKTYKSVKETYKCDKRDLSLCKCVKRDEYRAACTDGVAFGVCTMW